MTPELYTWEMDGEDEVAEIGPWQVRVRPDPDPAFSGCFHTWLRAGHLKPGSGEIRIGWHRSRAAAREEGLRRVHHWSNMAVAEAESREIAARPADAIVTTHSTAIPDGVAVGITTTRIGPRVFYVAVDGRTHGDIAKAHVVHASHDDQRRMVEQARGRAADDAS